MTKIAMTTTDNPYDPFRQWDEWYAYDTLMGYNTCSLLERFTNVSIDLEQKEVNARIEDAIDRIIELGINDKYKKVFNGS